MKKYLFLIISVFILGVQTFAQNLSIGLFPFITVKSIYFEPKEGEFDLKDHKGNTVLEIKSNDQIIIKYTSGQKIKVLYKNTVVGVYDSLLLQKKKINHSFHVWSYSPKIKKRAYYGSLKVLPGDGDIKLRNVTYIENYIYCVVQAESGFGKELEFYKVQATISRTYALSHINKHKEEGFNLCNRVHCQAYKGIIKHSPIIRKAVQESEGLVIVDRNIDLITASFFSNSGGYTVNSEDVWHKPLEYLRAKEDTFSITMPNYTWKKEIDSYKWKKYLLNNYKVPVFDSTFNDSLLIHKFDERTIYLGQNDYQIPLKEVRKDWKLKSTFFTVDYTKEKVVLTGKGFGHGVGLSQEGAMRMAKLGYSYKQIIHYYYQKVYLINISVLDFYKE